MIKPEEQIGKVAVANGKFYTPKYWVAKFKNETDVIIQTASKSLSHCKDLTEKVLPKNFDEDSVVYITIELRNVG